MSLLFLILAPLSGAGDEASQKESQETALKRSVETMPFPPGQDPDDQFSEPPKFKPGCGNKVLEPEEQCDDGNTVSGDGCTKDCGLENRCGNRIQEIFEQCDDGNTQSGDGCSAACEWEANADCGNRTVEFPEECDDGNRANRDACTNGCRNARCGDGIFQPFLAERCDDGGNASGDGCNLNCQREPRCGNQIIEPGEECDDGNTVDNDGCTNRCRAPFCGDGIVQPNEECDINSARADEICQDRLKVKGALCNRCACQACSEVGQDLCTSDSDCGPKLEGNDCICQVCQASPCPGIKSCVPSRGGCWTRLENYTRPGTVEVPGASSHTCQAECDFEIRHCGVQRIQPILVGQRLLPGGSYFVGDLQCACDTDQWVAGADFQAIENCPSLAKKIICPNQ